MIRITTNSSLRMYRSNLMKSTNSPVSYTHLDVYKRQIVDCVFDREELPGKAADAAAGLR